ncbi:MAG: hypothetical protein CMD36_03600 [Flavobacteriales bacterium]|nr:hypothetical protein [Flavobacteriales bacterium]
MNYQIQSIHFSLNKKLKFLINKKINKLLSINERINSVSVYMKIEKKSTFNNKLIEIKLNAPNFKFFAKKQANSFEKSVDLVFRALRKQILKIK